MQAWSFAARTFDEVAALVRALGRHRYLREADHRVHFTVLAALSKWEPFGALAAAQLEAATTGAGGDPRGQAPLLWVPLDTETVLRALSFFWGSREATEVSRRLGGIFERFGLPIPEHRPFESDPEAPPHPELFLLDWELLPVGRLSPERHAGALRDLELSGETWDPAAPVFHEALAISYVELTRGAPRGVLADDFFVWSDGPYAYADYVFRGASKAAKLVEPPVGVRDLEPVDS